MLESQSVKHILGDFAFLLVRQEVRFQTERLPVNLGDLASAFRHTAFRHTAFSTQTQTPAKDPP